MTLKKKEKEVVEETVADKAVVVPGTCPDCNNTGLKDRETLCPTCGGTGHFSQLQK